MYNPYAGLQNINPRNARTFRLPQKTEFVFQEEASVKRRGFGENLGYYTGSGYVGGAVCGGALGLAQGVMQQHPQGALQSRRLLLNRLLNSSGQTGRLAGALPRRASSPCIRLVGYFFLDSSLTTRES
jgi:mitochondrial import inner membrane translocase subunit TIM23